MKSINKFLSPTVINSLLVLLLVFFMQPINYAQAASSNAASPAADESATEGYQADLEYGEYLYADTCLNCHGPDGQGGPAGGAPLTNTLTTEAIKTIVQEGRNNMPTFAGFFDSEELEDISSYVLEVLVKP